MPMTQSTCCIAWDITFESGDPSSEFRYAKIADYNLRGHGYLSGAAEITIDGWASGDEGRSSTGSVERERDQLMVDSTRYASRPGRLNVSRHRVIIQ
jgi:hypothetical protein